MNPVTLPQYVGVLVFVIVCAALHLVFSRWSNRRDRPVLAVEDQTPDLDRADTFTLDSHHDGRFIVADYGRMAPLPEVLYEEPLVVDPPLSLREQRIVVPEVTA